MKKMSLLTVLVATVALTAYSVSGTYAKYTSTFEGTDSARVAKWAFTVGDTDTSKSNEFTFNLFDHTDAHTLATATKEVDGETVTEKIIAPGTQGNVSFKIANNSEVDANYTVTYNVTNNDNIPVEFSVDGGTTWTTSLTNVAATEINKNGGEATVAIQWRWAFTGAESTNFTTSQTDDTDTTLGKGGVANISVTATVTATQID